VTNAFCYVDETGAPRVVNDLAPFVTVKGGAYFFLPGLNGLSRILAN
jgi:hypothetical protein